MLNGDSPAFGQLKARVDRLEAAGPGNTRDIEKKCDDLKAQVDIDIGQLVSRCERIEERIGNLEKRFEFDPEVTIVAQNLEGAMESEAIVLRKAENLVNHELGLPDVKVVHAKRLVSRNGKPGLVKIEVSNLDDKKKVLRGDLKRTQDYKDVSLRSSKSHVERLQEMNTRVLLNELPNGHRYRITANGKLVPNDGYNGYNGYNGGGGYGPQQQGNWQGNMGQPPYMNNGPPQGRGGPPRMMQPRN